GVSRVKWYVDGAEVAYDHDGAPWSQSWDSGSVVNGGHRLLTKARDTHGNWSASASTAFDVHNEPCGHGGSPPATALRIGPLCPVTLYNRSAGHPNLREDDSRGPISPGG
ncbi:MAG: Ig-like domain-containing protein, partial [Planctomycetota bacterium]